MNAPRCDVTVIMVCHNGRELALAALSSALNATGAACVEWIVVDCGSIDGTPEAVEAAFPEMKVIRSGNVGFAAGNNLGLSQARGRYVLLLNPDTEILRGTLADLVGILDERPKVGAASVIQRAPDGSLLHSIRRFPSVSRQLAEALYATRVPGLSRLSEVETSEDRYASEGPADWVVGAFLIARRIVVEDVGGLDERFFLYSEETDWCWRIRKAGWDVRHLPALEILHHGGGTSRPELAAQLSFSKVLFAKKHFRPARAIAFRAALSVRHVLRVAVLTSVGRRRPDSRARAKRELLGLRVALGLAVPRLQADRATGKDAEA